MNILVIEDEADIYDSIARAFKRNKEINILPQCEINIDTVFKTYKIDLVILDLNASDGISGNTGAGDKIIRQIHDSFFLPIIIFSGFSNVYENPYKNKHFISTVNKGPEGINDLKQEVKKILPFVNKCSILSDEINSDISEIYRTGYEKLIKNSKIQQSGSAGPELFTRLVKRRLAVSIDTNTDNKPINAWEIYLYPCLGNEYLTGDILRKKGAVKKDPLSYRIILSPSCDLQKGREHIQNVKVACFCNIHDQYKKNDLVASRLRDTSPKQFVFFHKLEGEFPHMLCNFKEIETVNFDDLDKKFERIVSIDSPFRESIVWADITINGRPGLPDRDCESWLESIKEDCYQTSNTNKKNVSHKD
jgi:CTP synthase